MLLEVKKNGDEIKIDYKEHTISYHHVYEKNKKEYPDSDECTLKSLSSMEYVCRHTVEWRDIFKELLVLSRLYPNYIILDYDIKITYLFDVEKNGKEWTFFNIYHLIWYRNLDSNNEILGNKLIKLLSKLDKNRKIFSGVADKVHITLIKSNVHNKTKRKRTAIPKGLRHEVFKRDNYTCKECGAKKSDGATLHIDHIIPVSKGGTDELSNLQTLCAECNLNKNDVYQKIRG